MFEISAQYAYLVLTIPFISVWLLFWFLHPPTRIHQLFFSVAGIIVGSISEILYFKDYWLPESILSLELFGYPFMVEDIIFGFVIGGIASVAFAVLSRKSPVTYSGEETKYIRTRYLITILLALFLGIWYLSINSIYASSIAFLGTSVIILLIRKDLFRHALGNGFAVMGIMFLSYTLLFLVVSNEETLLENIWFLTGTPLDVRLFKIPLTELVWGFCLGIFAGVLLPYKNRQTYVRM